MWTIDVVISSTDSLLSGVSCTTGLTGEGETDFMLSQARTVSRARVGGGGVLYGNIGG